MTRGDARSGEPPALQGVTRAMTWDDMVECVQDVIMGEILCRPARSAVSAVVLRRSPITSPLAGARAARLP